MRPFYDITLCFMLTLLLAPCFARAQLIMPELELKEEEEAPPPAVKETPKKVPKKVKKTPRYKIALLDVTARLGVSGDDGRELTETILWELGNYRELDVLNRQEFTDLLSESDKKELLRCNERDCLARVGKRAGVNYLLFGEAARVETTYHYRLEVIDIADSRDRRVFDKVIENGTIGGLAKLTPAAIKGFFPFFARGKAKRPPPERMGMTSEALKEAEYKGRSNTIPWALTFFGAIGVGTGVASSLIGKELVRQLEETTPVDSDSERLENGLKWARIGGFAGYIGGGILAAAGITWLIASATIEEGEGRGGKSSAAILISPAGAITVSGSF
ncbi:MAG: hypothetical protein Kow0090_16180 [Myxococcota bacterium]